VNVLILVKCKSIRDQYLLDTLYIAFRLLMVAASLVDAYLSSCVTYILPTRSSTIVPFVSLVAPSNARCEAARA
jgi:hypothetical protein